MNSPLSFVTAPGAAPLPLVLGVTGHRDLRKEDIPVLEERVRGVFEEIRAHYRHTPLILLSALAEGADRLAARVALQCGVHLIAPLPLPREEYLRDMPDPASRVEFEELLQQAHGWFELPLATGNTQESICEQGKARDRQYAEVGAYIAEHSQILIALWDGVSAEAEGGTGHVVRFKLEGVPRAYSAAYRERSLLEAPDGGPVYHIVTPRQSAHQPPEGALSVRRQYPKAEGGGHSHAHVDVARVYDRIYSRMDSFNGDALTLGPRLEETFKQSKVYLLAGEDPGTLPAVLQPMVSCYAAADTLAQYFRNRMLRILFWQTLSIFVMALTFHIFVEWHNPLFLAAFPIVWLIAYLGLFQPANRGGFQNKHQDYRALAEGLRIQIFWRLSGLPDSVADHYLRKQRGELDWIRNAIQVWRIGATEGRTVTSDELRVKSGSGPDSALVTDHSSLVTSPTPSPATLPLYRVLSAWVEDQAHWFARTAHREHHKLERLEKAVLALLGFSLLLATGLGVILVAATYFHPVAEKIEGLVHALEHAHAWLVLAISIPPVIAALMHGYIDMMALAEQAKQYERMSFLFHSARRQLREAIDEGEIAEAQTLLRELGREALAENGDWVLLHRQRPLEMPSAA